MQRDADGAGAGVLGVSPLGDAIGEGRRVYLRVGEYVWVVDADGESGCVHDGVSAGDEGYF